MLVACGLEVYKVNGGDHLNGRSRIRRLVQGVRDALHFRSLLESMNEKQEQATVMFEHNSGSVSFSRSAKITPRTKHIDVKFHHVRSLLAEFLKNRLLLLGV